MSRSSLSYCQTKSLGFIVSPTRSGDTMDSSSLLSADADEGDLLLATYSPHFFADFFHIRQVA